MGVFTGARPAIARVQAVQHIRRMSGGSQAHMLGCSDEQNYIVKFPNNPQGSRTLANELLGTLLARYMGLPVPDPAIVDVTEDLIAGKRHRTVRYAPSGEHLGAQGACFGSKYLTPRMPGSHRTRSVEPGDLNRAYLLTLANLKDFAGMLVFDKWTGNTDRRQVIFVRNKDNRDVVVMIDFGYCFHAHNWKFPPYASIGVFGEWFVYNAIEGMEAFEPWLQTLEKELDEDVLRDLAGLIPPQWYAYDFGALSALLASLNERRKLVRELLWDCCSNVHHSFRNWMRPVGERYFVASH